MIRQRKKALPVAISVGSAYQTDIPAGFHRAMSVKIAGTYTGSGAGVVAGDGGFKVLNRPEVKRGGDAIIGLFGADLKWLSAFTFGAPNPQSPSVIAASGIHSSIGELAFDAFMPGAGIDARNADVQFAGQFGSIADLGTTVTAISGNLNVGVETTSPAANGDHFEPRWLAQSVDTSSAAQDLKAIKRIGNDVELCSAIMIRTYDASQAAGDPDAYRSDGMVRNIRVEIESGGQSKEVARYTWGEAKALSTTRARMAAAGVPAGVVIIPIRDPDGARVYNGALRLQRGDTLTVYLDTSSTIEGEFTALTPASGDQAIVTFINYVPMGAGAAAVRATRRR